MTPITEEEFLSRFQQEDRIYPVISLVFYYGLDAWDGSVDLYGMFHQKEWLQNSKLAKAYIPNYTLNLIDAGNIQDVKRFQTDLQIIFGMLQYRRKNEGLKEYLGAHQEYFGCVDLETYQAMRELLHSERQLKKLVSEEKGRETVNMCEALEALYNDGVKEGIEQGIEKGIEKGMEQGIKALIKTCKEFGLSKEEILTRIEKEFSVAKEAAEKYMEE